MGKSPFFNIETFSVEVIARNSHLALSFLHLDEFFSCQYCLLLFNGDYAISLKPCSENTALRSSKTGQVWIFESVDPESSRAKVATKRVEI